MIGSRTFAIMALTLATATAALPFTSSEARAFGLTTGLDLGIWRSTFKQEGYGQSVVIDTNNAPAISPNFGFLLGRLFFIEYAPYIYPAYLDGRSESNATNVTDAWSLLAFNGGFIFGGVPVELYAGVAVGTYGFNYNAKNDYSDNVLKLGATYRLALSRLFNLKFKLEYQRHMLVGDDGPAIPEGFKTTATVYALTVGFNFGKRFGESSGTAAPSP